MVSCPNTLYKTQLEQIETQIALYNSTITALLTGKVQSYSLNTGQTTQAVTKKNTNVLQNEIDILMGRYDTLYSRVYGCGVTHSAPGW